MNKLSIAERANVIRMLVEGTSINATCRILGFGKPTVLRLIKSFGDACKKYHDDAFAISKQSASSWTSFGRSFTARKRMCVQSFAARALETRGLGQ